MYIIFTCIFKLSFKLIDVFANFGLLATPGNDEEIAGHICRILESPDLVLNTLLTISASQGFKSYSNHISQG